MDLNRVFYANGIGFSFNPTEAVLIFRFRPIEQPIPQPDETGRIPDEGTEVVRVHVPPNLAHHLMTVMSQQYLEQIKALEAQTAKGTGNVPKT